MPSNEKGGPAQAADLVSTYQGDVSKFRSDAELQPVIFDGAP